MLYLENFQPYLIDRIVYPYRIVYPMQLESIDFAPITIFYGARIYDLDSHPSHVKEWFQLDNMKAYYQLFKKFEKRFEKD